jgi:hypothetical protein
MGREIKRVALDFSWPLREVWQGYLSPERLHEEQCPDCERGYSPRAEYLLKQWYGNAPFTPEMPLTERTPAVRAFAERNVTRSPEFYGTGEWAIACEARRLAQLWNGYWSHHLEQVDVDALVAAGRLMDLTHTWSKETKWQPRVPPVTPTAAQVNEWSISGFGHDSINAGVVIQARCEREGVSDTCATCAGHASLERYPGQRADAEAWEPEEPPAGDGYQLWETVSDGSPVSPVFATPGELATWMSQPDHPGTLDPITCEQALRFIDAGWAMSMVLTTDHGVEDGVTFMARTAAEEDLKKVTSHDAPQDE